MIQINCNADEFSRQLQAALAEFDQQLNDSYWSWTMRSFEDLVQGTPQWSGDTTANWQYSINSPSSTYQRIINKRDDFWNVDPVLSRGDFAAVSAAVSRAMDGPRPTYKDAVYFTNNTPIAPALEDHSTKIRLINLEPGTEVVMMAQFIAVKHANLPYDTSYYRFP